MTDLANLFAVLTCTCAALLGLAVLMVWVAGAVERYNSRRKVPWLTIKFSLAALLFAGLSWLSFTYCSVWQLRYGGTLVDAILCGLGVVAARLCYQDEQPRDN